MSDARQKGTDEMYCPSCGAIIKKVAELCPKCGVSKTKWRSLEGTEVFCTSCGEKILKEAEICPKCGVRQIGASQRTAGFTGSLSTVTESLPYPVNYIIAPLKKYAVFSGRSRRAEFWWFSLGIVAVAIAIGIISAVLTVISYDFFPVGTILGVLLNLGTIVPILAVWWRRMHDVGVPGGFCFIPICNIILAATPGQIGVNKYGTDPKES
jgi:uncharacterized membrane protein YhaH (DUF805 family)/predicted RNA-binding Zn-ribbon protein involved in translation (DUF1610 family)